MMISEFSGQKRFRWLLGTFAVLLFGVILLLRTDSVLRTYLYLPIVTTQPAPTLNDLLHPDEQEKRDPELGTSLKHNAVTDALRAAVRPGKSGYLLVFVGNCTGCMKVDFPRWAKSSRQNNVQMVGLTQASPEHISELKSQLNQVNVQMPIIRDPKSELIGAINSYYSGRAYLFSPQWQLKWMAHTLRSEADFWDTPSFHTALQEARNAR